MIVAHVAAVYDWDAVRRKWQQSLENIFVPANFVVVTVEAERRQRLGTGSGVRPRLFRP